MSILLITAVAALSCSVDSASSLADGAFDGGADADSDTDTDVDSDTDSDSGPSGDSDADGDSESGEDTDDPDAGETTTDEDDGDGGFLPCAGAVAGDHCWYLGVEQESCEETCAAHGGFDGATLSFAGSGGTDEQCAEVLDALGASGSSVYPLMGIGEGIGCASLSGARYRVADETTTAGATYVLARRACACAE